MRGGIGPLGRIGGQARGGDCLEIEAVRRTDGVLGRLPSSEWTVICDEHRRHGVDHVIAGPGGVFALASRRPEGVGAARVKDGMLWLRRGSDPREDRAGGAIGRSALESARLLRREIIARTGEAGDGPEVWPVVVLWCEFPQAVAEGSRIAFVRGLDLLEWISSRPRRLDPAGRARVADALISLSLGERAPSGDGAGVPASRLRPSWRRILGRRAA